MFVIHFYAITKFNLSKTFSFQHKSAYNQKNCMGYDKMRRKSMRYRELDTYWKRIFELEWISLCEGSKAIAALIVSDDGEIISEVYPFIFSS